MSGVLVGRDGPLTLLAGATERAARGVGGLVLVAGEAGIGKSALLAATAELGAAQRLLVLHGTCWDGPGAPGFWPWVQVLRGLRDSLPAAQWTDVQRRAGDGLRRLLGELGDAPVSSQDVAFQIFDAVVVALTAAAKVQPLLVVLDDVHCADPASVRLLDFVVRHAALEPVLIVAAYRDDEVNQPDHPLHDVMVGVSAKGAAITLSGLDVHDVALLVAEASPVPPEVITAIHRRTGGNPFFVEQSAELWRSTGSTTGLASGVRDAVARRLARLPSRCVDVLTTAALIGMECDLPLLAAATGCSAAALADDLEPARAARIVTIGTNHVRFVHDLVREELASTIPEANARARHAAILGGLAQRPDALPARVAHHAAAAVPDVPATVAVDGLLAAGRDAAGRLASEEACEHLQHAVDLIAAHGLDGAADAARQLGLQQQRAGALPAARATFSALAASAQADGDAEAFAYATLGLHALGHDVEDASRATLGLIDAARTLLADTPGHATGSALLARVTAAASQARSHHIGSDRAEGEKLSAAAVDMARSAGDPEALGYCLLARHDALWGSAPATERVGLADEMRAAARASGDRELELHATLLRAIAMFERGDAAALSAMDAFAELADVTRLPRFRYLALSRRGTTATLRGRMVEAHECIDAARELGERIGEVDARSVHHDQMWELARLQGDLTTIDELLRTDREHHTPLLPILEGLRALDAGDPAAALGRREEMEAVHQMWPQWAALVWLAMQAELATASDDPGPRRKAREALVPHLGSWAVLAGAVFVRGPLDYWAARLDVADRRWDAAAAGFAHAEEMAGRLGSPPWVLLARVGWADALLQRGEPGDADVARNLIGRADADATALGMTAAGRHIAALRVELEAGPALSGSRAFTFDGHVWTLTFGAATVRLPPSKGLTDLHTLLAHAGEEVSAAALLDPAGGAVALAATSGMGADAVLDDRAKAEYRSRLAYLDEAIDTTLDREDDARAAALDTERKALLDELGRAVGLGGRDRRVGDTRERARKAVTARVRDVLRRLDVDHPPLARHLRATVTTGGMCRYKPDDDEPWAL